MIRRFLPRRREEREYRARVQLLCAAGLTPVLDRPLELPAERIDVASGLLFDRRTTERPG